MNYFRTLYHEESVLGRYEGCLGLPNKNVFKGDSEYEIAFNEHAVCVHCYIYPCLQVEVNQIVRSVREGGGAH